MLNASKIIGYNYTYSKKDFKLTIELDTSKWNFRLKKKAVFSYQLNLNDCSAPCESSGITTPPNLVTDNGIQYLNPGDYVTLGGYYDSGGNQLGLTVYNNNGTLEFGTPSNPDSQYFWFQCGTDWRYILYPALKSGQLMGTAESCTNNYVTIENKGAFCQDSQTFNIYFETFSDSTQIRVSNCQVE